MPTFATRARTISDIATAVRDARIAAGMSQAELAAAAGLTRPWVSLFESGRTPNASLSKVLAMMDVLGMTVRLSYPVPDPEPVVANTARHPRHTPEEPDAVDLDALDSTSEPLLNEAALAAARAIRESHRARAVADEATRGSSDG